MSQDHDDFAFEDRPGIPAPLPAGEALLWQGSPDWKALAIGPFHARKVALWFVAIAAFELLWTLSRDLPLAGAVPGVAKTLALGAVAVGVLVLLAWLNGRVTIYSITTRRVLIRFGVALQVTMNLPFVQVREANVALGRDGVGDIPLALRDTRRVGYLTLWPHVRPWRIAAPEPMLRSVPDAARVAALLGAAMHAAAEGRPFAAPAPTGASPAATPAVAPVATGPSSAASPAAPTRSGVVRAASLSS